MHKSMQTVLEQGSIDKPLTFDVGLIQLGFIPICFSQIVPRVCTSVLFINLGISVDFWGKYFSSVYISLGNLLTFHIRANTDSSLLGPAALPRTHAVHHFIMLH